MSDAEIIGQLKNELSEAKAELRDFAEANESLNERILELYTLYNISRTLSMTIQLSELFELTMNVIGESLGIAQYCLLLLDDASGKLAIQASHGMPGSLDGQGLICEKESISWRVVKEGKAILINDTGKEMDHFYFNGSGIASGSYLGVPLVRKNGEVIGVLSAHKPVVDGFRKSDLRLFKAVAEHVAVAIDNAMTFQQTRELMHRDDLTNLYNRRYFFDRYDREVYRASRYDHPISVLMLDLDHFKNFNDTFGHSRGDEALKKIAHILEKNVRKADVIARYGGEEFLVLLPETSKEGAARVAEKLRSEVAATDFNADAPDLESAGITVTVGVAAMPEDTDKSEALIDLADKALYYGKARGRNQVCLQVPEA